MADDAEMDEEIEKQFEIDSVNENEPVEPLAEDKVSVLPALNWQGV